jgi:hypothetical protein
MKDQINEQDSELLLGLASYQAACCLGFQHSEVKQLLQAKGMDELQDMPAKDSGFQFKNCLLFIRMCRALDGVFCGNLQEEKDWISAESTILQGIPKELMKSPGGLVSVVNYLEGLMQHGEVLES